MTGYRIQPQTLIMSPRWRACDGIETPAIPPHCEGQLVERTIHKTACCACLVVLSILVSAGIGRDNIAFVQADVSEVASGLEIDGTHLPFSQELMQHQQM